MKTIRKLEVLSYYPLETRLPNELELRLQRLDPNVKILREKANPNGMLLNYHIEVMAEEDSILDFIIHTRNTGATVRVIK